MHCQTKADEFSEQLLFYQVIAIAVLFVGGLGLFVIEYFWPNFFNYPYFSWEVRMESIERFWPLFVYGAVLSCAVFLFTDKEEEGQSSFLLGVTTSVLAGLWEEAAYRFVFICYAMVLIVWSNFLLSTVVGTIIGAGLILAGFSFIERENVLKSIAALFVMAVGGFVLYLVWMVGSDPVFWWYRTVVVPFINFITFGKFHGIFHNGYPELFLFGMVSANGWFRSGHEYQGWYGMLNSWIIGFVLMYAMLHYGLLTAIVLHVLFDVQIDVIRFLFRR